MQTEEVKIKLLPNPWMTERETEWLIDRAIESHKFAEVGVWCGITTANISRNAPHCQVIGVDKFTGSPEHLDPASRNYEKRLEDPEWLITEATKNTQGLNVQLIKIDSLLAAFNFYICRFPTSFDTVFLDASHEYEDVLADIAAWLPLVTLGGILCGHDYDYGWPGVVEAVDKYLPSAEIVPGTSIWMYRKSKEHGR